MSVEALQVAKAYHHLLKAIKNQVAKEETKRHFRDYVTEEFRNNYKLSDLSSIQQKIKLARDYTFLLNSVHHHKVHLFSASVQTLSEVNQGLIMSSGGAQLLAGTASKTNDPQTLRMVAGALANLCGNGNPQMRVLYYNRTKPIQN